MNPVYCKVNGCTKKFINDEFLARHVEADHKPETGEPKSKRWRTPYGFGDFIHPVTYAEACETMKAMADKFFGGAK